MPESAQHPYETDLRFAGYYLEDSYVLSIEEQLHGLRFQMDFVLTPEHPEYREPTEGKQHCYRRGHLAFSSATACDLDRSHARPSADSTGGTDLGNIDWFNILPDNRYDLGGDWGELKVIAAKVEIALDN